MLNANVDKYIVEFSSDFYNTSYLLKYNNFLYLMNGPIKNLQDHINESIQSIIIPGLSLNSVTVPAINNLNNVNFNGIGSKPKNMVETTIDRQYPGNAPLSELFNSRNININFKNTVINWMYFYEYFRDYFSRERTVKDFRITITVMDAGEIPMLQFIFSDCFISTLPDLEFVTNQNIREPRNIDVGFTFNKYDTKFIIPSFNSKNISL